MAFLQWKKVNFFDKEIVKDASGKEAFEKLKDIDINACSSGRGQMIFGDFEGNLYFLNRNLELTSFKAYEIRVSHLFQMKQHNILVSIGEDEEGINPLIKVWNLDKVSCLTVHENLSLMAVGFENGSVLLFKGDITKERHSKQKVVYEGPHVITYLAFRTQGKNSILFTVTENHVMAINISLKTDKHKISPVILEQHGCKLRCATVTDVTQGNQLVIGRQDAVFFYQPDDRGQCLAFEGEKLQLHWFRSHLVIIGKGNKGIPRTGKAVEMNTVTVYDIHNKFIAYSSPIPEVLDVLFEWGSIYILAGDRKLYQLQEKDTQSKLEILFKKNFYMLAINLAQSQQYDQEGVIDIYRQYGDHLYSKGDHDGAIAQYIKTIGKLEASYVIRKFLDAQRIHNLTAYLEALHKAQLATEDHTTLLLNCYTKLKDVSRLDDFIMRKDREVDFEVETAIKVLRGAGYYEHALYLAEQHSRHDWYLKIQLEDIRDYEKALQYIGKLPFEEAEGNLKKYGKVLMSQAPKDTTQLLKRLCTDYKPADNGKKAHAEEFIHIFVNNSQKLTEFLEHMVKVDAESSSHVYNTLLELYLHEVVHERDISKKVEKERKTLELLQNPEAGYGLDQALVMCQMNNFKAGILYLYEKAKLYQQILRYHMEHNEYIHIIETCKKFGMQEPHLWTQALSYFAGREEDCKTQITEVLSHIDKWNLLPPLLVVQTLAHNSTTTLALLKDYIVKRLQHENEQIAEDERLIKQYRDETAKMRNQIDELKTSAKIFQVLKCKVCSHPLELPSIHFLCQHSYHQHCFESYAENDSECPACMPDNRKVLDIIKAQEHSKDLHEQFHHQLERAQDGFSVVADYFGRGVFNKVTLITDPPSKHAIAQSLPSDPAAQRQMLINTNPFSTNPFGEY